MSPLSDEARTEAGIRASDAAVSYWSVVATQLRKNHVSMYAWAVVQGMVVVAMAAPLISMNVPLVSHGPRGTSAPLLSTLFDRFLYAGGVDVFFNLLLLLAPCWTIGRWLGERRPPVAERPAPRLRPTTLVIAAWATVFVGRIAGSAWGFGAGLPVGLLVGGGVILLRTPVVPIVAFLAYLLFGALTGARLVGTVLLMAGVPGALLLFWARSRAPATRSRAAVRARFALVLLFLGTFGWLLGPGRDTAPVVDYTAQAATERAAGTGWAVFPPVRFHPDNVGEGGQAPAARSLAKPSAQNVLGCDQNGRDVVARLVFGSRFSLTIGLVAVAILISIGIILGSLAGYYQGKVDLLIMRLVEVMICFPTMFLLLTIVAIFDSRSIFLIMGAIGLVGWPGVTRLVRAEFLRQRGLDYVTAARSQGIPQRKIIFGHVLPNCMGPVLVSATFGIASAILTESGLAFLGLGDTTAPSWGQMLNAGRSAEQWHLILAPGAAIFLVVTVFNLLGEGVRDALDPKLRR